VLAAGPLLVSQQPLHGARLPFQLLPKLLLLLLQLLQQACHRAAGAVALLLLPRW
jgi:hypothetical protein